MSLFQKDRGIRLESGSMEGKSKACSAEDLLETHHPSAAKVRLDDEGKLHWPVMFLYPEYGQTDLIEAFSEDVRLVLSAQYHCLTMNWHL